MNNLWTSEDAESMRCCGPEGCGDADYEHEPPMKGLPIIRFCIAERCMAWRIHHHENVAGKSKPTPFGYCGLAGKPS